MRIAVPHGTTKEQARSIVEQRLDHLLQQYGQHANDIQKSWTGDILDFAFKAKGISGKGMVEVTETEVIVDGKLPLLAKPFESRIRSAVEREAAAMFRRA
jgi:putative polyhydroxyalkanoate system protein